jgi:hypothetical protein
MLRYGEIDPLHLQKLLLNDNLPLLELIMLLLGLGLRKQGVSDAI